ncbi:MAG: hypothetical protein R2854_22230 [Caldilineaceae bacterium]
MDQSTVLDYGDLTAEQLEYWQKRATWEWSMRPGPVWTFLKGMNSWEGAKSAVNVGWQMVRFSLHDHGRAGAPRCADAA